MKIYVGFCAVILTTLIVGCTANDGTTEAGIRPGRYVGYSWRGEAGGTAREDASQYVETTLEINGEGTITEATMWFWKTADGFWYTRQSGNAYVKADFSVDPQAATPGSDYSPGESMLTVYTADMMSFYATAVDANGTIAVAIVDPITRYQMEMKLPLGADLSVPMGEVTIASGRMVPTIRTSGSGFIKPESFDAIADRSIFSIHDEYSHVVNDQGVLAGVDESSTLREFVAALGVEFEGDSPVAAAPAYGYFGLGGWKGNYDAIAEYLTGRNVTETTSLVNWDVPKFAEGVNDQGQFGTDATSGATRTAQWSVDGISGATVRMSRESTSYQRALVAAGIIEEESVVVGRF